MERDSYLHYSVVLIFFGSREKYFFKFSYCLQIPLFSLSFLADTNKIPSQILRIIRFLYVGCCIGKLMTAPLNF